MSGRSSKRLRSSEPQGSVKRPNQEQDPQPVSQLEKAQELFREARESKLYNKLLDLIRRRASPQESQACYSSIFKELALIIIGRDDIPVPPSASHLWTFLNLCNPNLEREEWEFAMETLITYIKTEDEKKPTLQTPTSNPKPSESLKLVPFPSSNTYDECTPQLSKSWYKQPGRRRMWGMPMNS
ncbi:hypothetical protein H2248_012630 [Termitomyces sp. 'cryptogamus']|nr:hypothetical protein H2248_012630 [Termitomyces sp. 'cryptogamus']